MMFGFWTVGIALAAVGGVVVEAEQAALNSARVEIVAQESFRGGHGVSLKPGVAAAADDSPTDADLTFTVQVPKAGRYGLNTFTATDAAGAEKMRQAKSKFESLYARIQVGDQPPTRRVIMVPWSSPQMCAQLTGVFSFSGQADKVRFWLPPGVRLDRIELNPYRAPTVPKEAADYCPAIVPPAQHPRLWVDAQSLAQIRARLGHAEHKPHWDRVQALAHKPFAYQAADREVPYNTPLEQAALARAFCYLVADERKAGREAADLMLAYLPHVEFGNLLDITREVGAAIYAGSCVYDWCYDLLTPDERQLLRRHLMRLAEEMECGWPPFKQSIINGHGNEAQINRDLLAMSIAIYDEDPLPYQYCSYCVLEQLAPMRCFEYQSPRHNQGISYAAYRFGWEMQAAWLFRRLSGREVFDANIKTVPQYWLYMRLPNGEMFRDGDGVSAAGVYWRHPQTFLLCYAYSGDPIVKGEYVRQSAPRSGDSILFLLLNDPDLQANENLDSLPRTLDFGPILGGMVARTGWNMGAKSADVVAEVKGGGYHFGNHQHADAGAFQIYYRGLQTAALAQYKFYGTPYDMNFAKRSIAQNMVLVLDPQEKFINNLANDGGARFLQSYPRTPQQAQTEPTFNYGTVVSCGAGPDARVPDLSYFAADLTKAYSAKVAHYVRRFCFVNLQRPGNPAAMIVLDDVTAAQPDFRKYWQLTALQPPQETPDGVRLSNSSGGVTGHLDVRLLWPPRAARTMEILSGAEANSVFGQKFTPPLPQAAEAQGHRIMVAPRQPQARDRFLAVMQACDGEPLPIVFHESEAAISVQIADRLIVLPQSAAPASLPLEIVVPGSGSQPTQVHCAGLGPGTWRMTGPDAAQRTVTVAAGRNIACLSLSAGKYQLAPPVKPTTGSASR